MAEEKVIPLTGMPLVDAAFARVRERFLELEDAMLVSAHLEAGAARRLKEHARFLDTHKRLMEEHALKMREIGDKLNLDDRLRNAARGRTGSHGRVNAKH